MSDRELLELGSGGDAFERSVFAQMIAGTGGRIARIAAGLGLVGTGVWLVGGTRGTILAVAGLVPLAAGTFDVCLVAPLFGAHVRGQDIRARRRGAQGVHHAA